MNATLVRATRISFVAARIAFAVTSMGCGTHAFAGQELLGVDSQFRAKIAKEKIRIAAQERKAEEQGKSFDQNQNNSCGSQNIGNVDTGGRIGAAPREVFVFAPNAINIVGRGSCR
ncbi:hypothetical protein QTI66_26295 [Variovorax sp. J22R133]|uniref:hypothetical protein n=1 Tax=Variovorax brevis TaxID=3053503 RepID=UPI002574D506|nr:hypothetical protein [Variovorax sp. J22R133]MDM0115688.1 hypothetical protein [Variovorax sp. J22R133]